MNIGIFTDTYYPQINGVVTSTTTLFEELKKKGHNVYIFTPNDIGVNKKTANEKNIYRLPSMPFVFSTNYRMTFVYPPKMFLLFKRLNLDIIHTQTEFSIGFLGGLVADFYNIPCVHTYHTMYEDYVHYIFRGKLITKKGAKRFSRVFCNSAEHIIAPAEKTRKALIDYKVKKPISVIPTGLDLSVFSKEISKSDINKLKTSLNIPLDKKVVLVLGRVAKEKSIDIIVKQFPKILKEEPNAILLIVGSGPDIPILKDLAKKNKIHDKIIFTGFIKNKEIHKYYKLGDVFVTASTSETQGLTYIEAMASSVPVVAKQDDCLNGLIYNNKNGLIFSKDEDLAPLVLSILNSKEKSSKFVQNSLKLVEKYNSTNFVNSVFAVYEETIKSYNKNKFIRIAKKIRG